MGGFVGYPQNIKPGVHEPWMRSSRNYRYTFDHFRELPMAIGGDGTTAAAGTTGATNLIDTGEARYEQHIKGAGQTIIVPKQVAATGWLDVSLDQTDNEGAEYIQGGSGVQARHAYTIGTDKAFFTRLKFAHADISGTDEFIFGFRKRQAFAAAHATYTDYTCLGFVTAANPGAIKIVTDNDDAGETATDTTQTLADGITCEFKVLVNEEGRVTYQINGVTPTATVAYQFDDADTVVPFLFYLHATTSPGVLSLGEWETGFQRVNGM